MSDSAKEQVSGVKDGVAEAKNKEGDEGKRARPASGDKDDESNLSYAGADEDKGDYDGESATAEGECADEEVDQDGPRVTQESARAEDNVAHEDEEQKEAKAAQEEDDAERDDDAASDEDEAGPKHAATAVDDEGTGYPPSVGVPKKSGEWMESSDCAPRRSLASGSCRFKDCYKYEQYGRDGMCRAHFELTHPGDKATKPKSHSCRYEGCEKYSVAHCRGMCRAHFELTHPGEKAQLCRYKDCDKYVKGNCDGMCHAHFVLTNPGKVSKRSAQHCCYNNCKKYALGGYSGTCIAHSAVVHPGATPKKKRCRYENCTECAQGDCNGMCKAHFSPKRPMADVDDANSVKRRMEDKKGKDMVGNHESAVRTSLASASRAHKSLANERDEGRWLERLEELRAFRDAHGNCDVPQKWGPNKVLARWVSQQRVEYKKLVSGDASAITRERVGALDAVGFEWNAFDAAWTRKFDDLRRFRAQKGHCNVPLRYAPDPSLGRWVVHQRHERRKMKEGKPSQMTEGRLASLEELGFEWATLDKAWEKRLSELKRFAEENGHCDVPYEYEVNRQLGHWVRNQRTQYSLRRAGKRHRLTDYRLNKLESMGFTWSVNPAKRNVCTVEECKDHSHFFKRLLADADNAISVKRRILGQHNQEGCDAKTNEGKDESNARADEGDCDEAPAPVDGECDDEKEKEDAIVTQESTPAEEKVALEEEKQKEAEAAPVKDDAERDADAASDQDEAGPSHPTAAKEPRQHNFCAVEECKDHSHSLKRLLADADNAISVKRRILGQHKVVRPNLCVVEGCGRQSEGIAIGEETTKKRTAGRKRAPGEKSRWCWYVGCHDFGQEGCAGMCRAHFALIYHRAKNPGAESSLHGLHPEN